MAEKYSRFRDPGTGIQVFLTPVAPNMGPAWGALIATPVFALLGVVRGLVAALTWLVYVTTRWSGCLRLLLACFGFWSLQVETVASSGSSRAVRSNAKAGSIAEKGDLVICNHSSWLDLLILLHAYPGATFIAPIVENDDTPLVSASASTNGGNSRKLTPRKNAMSAHTTMVTPPSQSARSTGTHQKGRKIVGYTVLPLIQALHRAGKLPITRSEAKGFGLCPASNVDAVLETLSGPGILYPECTTSNNRALLALDPTISLPTAGSTKIHIVSIKYTSPTTSISPTSTYSAPTARGPLPWTHAARLLGAWPHRRVQIRALPPQRGISTLDEVANGLSTAARLKKTTIGWQEKADFLTMLGESRRR